MLPVILFIIKLYARLDIFKLIKRKHGQVLLNEVRTLEKFITKKKKLQLDIDFIKSCKRERLIPVFANIKLSIYYGKSKLKQKIARLIMETEIQNKHLEKKETRKIILEISAAIRKKTTKLIYFTIS